MPHLVERIHFDTVAVCHCLGIFPVQHIGTEGLERRAFDLAARSFQPLSEDGGEPDSVALGTECSVL